MRGERSTIEIEYLHPVLKEGTGLTSANIVTLSSRIKTGINSAVIVELPWVNGEAAENLFFATGGQSAIGNPYLGLEFESNDKEFFGEVGVRAPLMSEQSTTAAIAGIAADFDRFEAYTPNIFQVGGALNLKPELGSGFSIRLRCGPTFDFSSRESGGSETLINYAALLGYESESAGFGVGIVGRANTSQNTSNSTIDQFEGSIRLHADSFHPALQFRTPLDEGLSNLYDLEFGINLAVQF